MDLKNDNMNFDFDHSVNQGSTGMKVPDGYFENLDKTVLAKIDKESDEKSSLPTIGIVKWVGVLAMAASLIWGGFFFFSTEENVSVGNEELAATEIIDYLDEMDEYFIAENLSISDIENVEIESEYITSDEILNYIENQQYSEYIITESF